MARLFDDAALDKLVAASSPVTVPPFTVACWFFCDDTTAQRTLVSLPNTGFAARYHALVVDGTIGGDPISAISANGGTSGTASSTTGFTANTWHLATGVWTSATSRAVFIDGGSKGTNTTSVTPASTPNSVGVGFFNGSVPDRYFSGRIAEVKIWNVALSDAEVLADYNARGGLPPQPSAIVGDWPVWGLHSPEIDLSTGNRLMTVTGATLANHAPVVPFSSRNWGTSHLIEAAAGAVGHYYRTQMRRRHR